MRNISTCRMNLDVVVGLFSLFHFPDRLAVLREVVRVLRRGGLACFGVGSCPPLTPRGWSSRFAAARTIEPRACWLNAPDTLDRIVAEVIPVSGRGRGRCYYAARSALGERHYPC